ncbi:hypothetical protein [Pedobacter sp. W3I1]|uniref:hypothetical protein n=1 Tax=Pedobacter sp. W3I1 TaxID=3042291 RepID=UPI0027D9150A|nr:hypothetical protein [Pedobacter sp. W3I1]
MPTSRTRKKTKKKIKNAKLPTLRQLTETMRSNGMAPDPIKMKYFEASFDGTEESTFEERLDALKTIGKNASENFTEKYHKIKYWIGTHDQPKLISFVFYYFMVAKAGYDEEAMKGSIEFQPYYQELLQAFALTLPRNYDVRPFSAEVGEFKKDFMEIGECYRLKQFNFPASVLSADDLPFHLLRTEMIMNTTAVRNWSYDHQMKKVTLDLAAAVSPAFTAHHGFDPVVFLQLLYSMTEEVEERINIHRLKTVEIMRHNHYEKIFDAYEAHFPTGKTDQRGRKKLWKMFGKSSLRLKQMFLMHSDLFLEDLFTFDFPTLESLAEGKISAEKLQEAFGLISLNFGDLADFDPDHFLLSNPVQQKPFIKLDEKKIFSGLWSVMTHFSMGLLESLCAMNEKLRNKYNEIRGTYLENEIAKLFRSSFPMAKVYPGSLWHGKDGKRYENDLLVIINKFALVIEAKAGTVSPPAKRAAPDRLFKTLRELIEEPSEQALRFIEFLQENPGELSLKVKKGPNNRFSSAELKYFIPLGVTLSHLGMMGSNLKQLINAGVTDKKIEELATSVSLTDLQVVFDLLPFAAEKIHYLQRRRELEANIQYMGDELDLLAWYLDEGFNFGKDLEKIGLFKMDLKSKELDNYIIGTAHGEKVIKPELTKTRWWKDMLIRLEEKQFQTWLETSYILLNVPIDLQQYLEKFVDEQEQKMHNGKAEFLHNWILLETADKERQFTIAGYSYYDRLREERDDIMGDILYDARMDGAKGKLVIGMNIDKPHYPYSVLGCWLSSELFENRYLKNIKADE